MLVGVVVKNKDNEYLLLKKKIGNQIDLGLIGGEVDENNLVESVRKMLISQVGYDFSRKIDIEPLMRGEDQDGEYVILFAETYLGNCTNNKTEFLWCTFSKIKRLFKENRLNSDQFRIFQEAEKPNLNKSNNAMKVSHLEERYQRRAERFSYEDYVERYGDKRIFLRLVRREAVKPCGKESRLKGELIANQFNNHKSFKNFPNLMDDEEFLLNIAKTSINPAECEIYFYDYVNQYLKKNKEFRLKFLKAIYLNDNVYKLEDINSIVEYLQMEEENILILSDLEFRRKFEKRIKDLDNVQLEYHCSGEDEKELHGYKIKANELSVLVTNKKIGLKEILNSFTVGEKVEIDDEPKTFYEYLCRQAYGNKSTDLI